MPPNVPLVLGEAVMILGADRRALSAAFLAARLEGESTFSKIAASGTVAMVAMGAAAATGISAAIKAAANLEFAVSSAGAVAYATTEQLARMTKQSLELSQTSTFTAKEIAGGFEILVKAGLDLEDALNGGAAAAVTLAQAGGTTLAGSADIVATAMKVWKKEAEDLPDIINDVAAAANVSRFDVDDLSRAIGIAGPTVANNKISFQDFMTTIAATAQGFHTGADAGTAFKTFLLRLNPTTKTAREEMKRLNLITEQGENRFFDATGTLRPMVDVIGLLHETLGDLSGAEQTLALKKIFGERGIRLATQLVSMTSEEFQQLDKYMQSLDVNEIAAARLDNAQGAAMRLLRTVQALGIEVGRNFLDSIKTGASEAARELPKIFDAFTEGLTGKRQPARAVVPTPELLRSTTNTTEEGTGRGMPGAGPSRYEDIARRAGDMFRTQVIPRLGDMVAFIHGEVLPALSEIAQHDIWPKLLTASRIVGVILVNAFKMLVAVAGPVLKFLSDHEEVVGALIASYLTYIGVSKALVLAFALQTAAVGAYRGIVTAATTAQILFNMAATGGAARGNALRYIVGLLGGRIGALSLAIAALVGVGILLYKNWDRIEDLFGRFAPVIAVLAGGVYALTIAWIGYNLIVKQTILAQAQLAIAMMATPWGAVIAAIGALIGIGVVLALNLDTIEAKFNELNRTMVGSSSTAQTWSRNVVTSAINAARGSIPPLAAIISTIELVRESMDALNKQPTTGGRPEGEVGGRITADDLSGPTTPEGGHAYLEPAGEDWRTAPPSNPNFVAPSQRPPAPKGTRYNEDGELEPDFEFGDYELPEGGWQMPDFDAGGGEDEATRKKKEQEDRLKNAIDSLNTRFFTDLSEALFKNPNVSLTPLINKQNAIRAEVSRTAQMLMDTLGVDLPTAFERASELVLERIDEMERELEKGPKVSGFLGWLAAWSDNIKKFDVQPAQLKVGDNFILNGGLHIESNPDEPVTQTVETARSVWQQQKFAKQG